MKSDSFSSQIPLDADDIAKSVDQALPAVDASRTQGYARLGQLRDAKANSLSREQKLLAQKHGTADHPRIAAAQQRFASNEQFRREIAVVGEVSDTPVPQPDQDTLVVHGFVRRRSDHTGLPGLTLALTDDDGNWIRELGYACTDQRGYFRLDAKVGRDATGTTNTTGGDIKSPTEMNVEAAKREAEAKAAAEKRAEATGAASTTGTTDSRYNTGTSGMSTSGDNKRTLQLRVYDSKGHVLHTETRPVIPRGGTIDYRYILLGDEAGECSCTPPPAKAGGRPSSDGPKPSANNPPTAVPAAPDQPVAQPLVRDLKSYTQPTKDELSEYGQPVEAIRGIGPKSGDKLRSVGIKDVAGFSRTEGSALVKLAGFDKTPPKTTASTPAKTTPPKPAAAPAATASAPAASLREKVAKSSASTAKKKTTKKRDA